MSKSKKPHRAANRATPSNKNSKSASRSSGTAHNPTFTSRATVEAKPVPNAITTQAIADAAYFLWQQRGGNELVNWLEAEAMLKRQAAGSC